MKRRDFVKYMGPLAASPLLLSGLPVQSFATPDMLPLLNCQGIDDRILVVVFLGGGNDGVNTLVPINQYNTYMTQRPTIGLASSGTNSYINLDSTLGLNDQVGLHPVMTNFKAMYDNGKASAIQGVGYPNPNQSHFKSTDLWLTAGDGTSLNFNIQNGWMGRYLEAAYPNVHGNSTATHPDPLGIQLGDRKPSLGFHNHANEFVAANLTGQNPSNLSGLINGIGTQPHINLPISDFGDELQYIMNVENSTNTYAQQITNVYNAGTTSASASYPNTYLASQLKIVSKMISGGSTTKIYMVRRGGFDTHANQVESGSSHTGEHANLLADVFNSIKAFHDDMNTQNLEDRILTVTFSEFGRRVLENGSYGTDHGSLAPMFLFGPAVEAGVLGTNIDLLNINNQGNPINQMQYDYRAVFQTLIQDWLGANNSITSNAMLGNYGKLPLINTNYVVDPSCYMAPYSTPTNTNMPVQMTASPNGNYVELEWKVVENSTDIEKFIVERSEDGTRFEQLFEVENDASFTTFTELDETPLSGKSFYRLQAIKKSGKKERTPAQPIEMANLLLQHIRLYPNPAQFDAQLVMTAEKNMDITISIFSVLGALVASRTIPVKAGFNKFPIDVTQLTAGNYALKISQGSTLIETLKLNVVK